MKFISRIIDLFTMARFPEYFFASSKGSASPESRQPVGLIKLPGPRIEGKISIEAALQNRRSVRAFTSDSLTFTDVAQILWATQGITEKFADSQTEWHGQAILAGLRTAPSAGALYPLEVYLAAAKIADLHPGLYKYVPNEHALGKVLTGELINAISEAALKQNWINEAPAVIVITSVFERTAVKYGARSERYIQMECGAVCQNIYLQACALGIGTVLVGAFYDEKLKSVLQLPANESPLSIMPLGKIQQK